MTPNECKPKARQINFNERKEKQEKENKKTAKRKKIVLKIKRNNNALSK